MPTGRLLLVHFRIDGCVEIEAKHMDQAWELARALSLRDLADGDPVVTVAIEYLESEYPEGQEE